MTNYTVDGVEAVGFGPGNRDYKSIMLWAPDGVAEFMEVRS